jgi:Chaperone of endosialidase
MQNNIANYGMLTSAGGFEQQQAQNQINAQMAKFNQAFQYPQQQLGIMESALGMTPYDTTTSGSSNSTTTQTQSNPAAMALGGLQTLGGLFSAPAGGTSAAAGLFSMLSDERMKTDVTELGKDPTTGLKMHAYRYKGDPKSYPKVVGPMAQDVQKLMPGAVRKVGSQGRLAIDMAPIRAPIRTPRPGALAHRLKAPGAPILGALGG